MALSLCFGFIPNFLHVRAKGHSFLGLFLTLPVDPQEKWSFYPECPPSPMDASMGLAWVSFLEVAGVGA